MKACCRSTIRNARRSTKGPTQVAIHRRRGKEFAASVLVGTWLSALPAAAQTSPSTSQAPTYRVEVIETTPLPALDLRLEQIPSPVQTAVSGDLDASGSLDLADLLNRRFTGVFINEIQGNPYQPDVNFRGYTASPLLGTPQGLSIYMDGVRLNQPFGDVVSWDLIPRFAISSTTLIPGSNPLFGLNTLGGALSLQTKDGRSNPGTTVRAVYGSDQRRSLEFEHGGSRSNGVNWYLGGNIFAEDGWRDASPSNVGQVFGKLGRHLANSDTALSVGYVNNSLTGNGLQEQQLLARDYASVYTIPDRTDDRATFINLTTRHDRSRTLTLSGNVYYRHIATNTLNGDINEDSLDQSLYQPSAAEIASLAAAGYSGFPVAGATAANTPFPSWRCIANVLRNDEPGEKCNALLNRTDSTQDHYGVSGQITFRDFAMAQSVLTIGAGYDGSRSSFHQSTQLGYLNPDRSVTGLNGFADGGVTGGTVDGVPYDNRVSLDGHVNTGSVFASDVWTPQPAWTVTLSARFNRTAISNADELFPVGVGSLSGDHAFGRLSPAGGVTFSPSREVNLYAGYSEGSRAPTSIELGCADPNAPCKLPNALAGDPPLDQVVTHTWEAGARGMHGVLTWNAGVFHAVNSDDILFVASTQTGFGYFKNFGRTRRQGVELGLSARRNRVGAGLGYTWLDATFQSPETLSASGNSTNDEALAGQKGFEGNIQIQSGDRIPLIPRQQLKVYGDLEVTHKLSVDIDVLAAGSIYARGNENNRSQPDGVIYLGSGTTPAYGIVNLGARYQLTKVVQLIAQVNNLFDHHYYTASQLGPNGITSAGTFIARPFPAVNGEFPVQQSAFEAPGAPTTYWIGTRVTF
jgi:outer membrane receptor protein involved in Fe transport